MNHRIGSGGSSGIFSVTVYAEKNGRMLRSGVL